MVQVWIFFFAVFLKTADFFWNILLINFSAVLEKQLKKHLVAYYPMFLKKDGGINSFFLSFSRKTAEKIIIFAVHSCTIVIFYLGIVRIYSPSEVGCPICQALQRTNDQYIVGMSVY